MATPQSQPGFDAFIPELWTAAVMENWTHQTVFAQPNIVSSDYTGEITQKGDTVHVAQIGSPTVKDYDESTDLEIEDLNITDSSLVVDQGDYFAFRVPDVSALQAAGPVKDPAMADAAFKLRDKTDTYMAGVMRAGAGTKLGAIDVDPESRNGAWNVLLQLRKALNQKSVPTVGRYAVIGAEYESALLMDDRFIRADAAGTTDGLRNGLIGRALGFDIYVSNNTPTVASREFAFAGVPAAASFVQQITKIETAREERRFADLVKGLSVYGGKVFRPDGLVSAEVNLVAPAPAGE